jgi:hypothetical protein
MAAEFTGVQPLPERPGAMAAQPVRRKGEVTAGRPLPPRVGEAAVAGAAPTVDATVAAPIAAPVAAPVSAPPAVPAPAAVAATVAAKQTRPDIRPMRLAFGAGAVAAVGALTIGMVRPDFSGTATDEATAAQPVDEAAAREADVRVRRITNYVLLNPGEKAPKGATVISAAELLGLGEQPVVPDRRRPNTTDRERSAQADGQPTAQADRRAAQPERQPQPQADKPPQPQPDPPRVTTRQSGG